MKLKLEPEGKFLFSATKDGVSYEIDIELADKVNAEVNAGQRAFKKTLHIIAYASRYVDSTLVLSGLLQESKVSVGVRSIVYVIQKSEKKWWTRLLKQEGKPPAFLKVDWDKWVDEEDEGD